MGPAPLGSPQYNLPFRHLCVVVMTNFEVVGVSAYKHVVLSPKHLLSTAQPASVGRSALMHSYQRSYQAVPIVVSLEQWGEGQNDHKPDARATSMAPPACGAHSAADSARVARLVPRTYALTPRPRRFMGVLRPCGGRRAACRPPRRR